MSSCSALLTSKIVCYSVDLEVGLEVDGRSIHHTSAPRSSSWVCGCFRCLFESPEISITRANSADLHDCGTKVTRHRPLDLTVCRNNFQTFQVDEQIYYGRVLTSPLSISKFSAHRIAYRHAGEIANSTATLNGDWSYSLINNSQRADNKQPKGDPTRVSRN